MGHLSDYDLSLPYANSDAASAASYMRPYDQLDGIHLCGYEQLQVFQSSAPLMQQCLLFYRGNGARASLANGVPGVW